ncbi:MAG: Maf family protein [Caldisericia bacterium]|nr:Maf family protein [Caldisericia bacterium]
MDIILASNSSRRKDIFRVLLPQYRSVNPACSELSPLLYNRHEISFFTFQNAQLKANCVWENTFLKNALVIGCDTAIATATGIVGKPFNTASAFAMLKDLSDTSHLVVSSVAILRILSGCVVQRIGFSEPTKVTFSALCDAAIQSYVTTNKPFDKAGAYGIQEIPSSFIASIEGSVWNVIGFPVETFCDVMDSLGVPYKEITNEYNFINRG